MNNYYKYFEANEITNEFLYCRVEKFKWRLESLDNHVPDWLQTVAIWLTIVLYLGLPGFIFSLFLGEVWGPVLGVLFVFGTAILYESSKKHFSARSELLLIELEKEYSSEIELYCKVVEAYFKPSIFRDYYVFKEENEKIIKELKVLRYSLKRLHSNTYLYTDRYNNYSDLNDFFHRL